MRVQGLGAWGRGGGVVRWVGERVFTSTKAMSGSTRARRYESIAVHRMAKTVAKIVRLVLGDIVVELGKALVLVCTCGGYNP